jgi:hypothetical protein
VRHTTTGLLLAACLTLAGCSSSATDDKPAAKATATTPTPSEAEFTAEDCKTLLEKNFAADANTDVSGEPECAGLARDEYVKAVGDVLTGHKDDILADAADEAVYDEAWDGLGADGQATTCSLLEADGPESVGILLSETVKDPSVDTDAMAKYFYAEKC